MSKKQHTYSKSVLEIEQYHSSPLNSYGFIGPFYSIKLKEYNKVFNIDMRSLHNARAHTVILFHLSNYSRCLQTNMAHTYGFSWPLINKVVNQQLELGLIRPYLTKRKTNLDRLVPLTAYSITVEGKARVKELNELLQFKVSLLKR